MSMHIGAEPGQIAETILLAGDPLRARYVAQTFLKDFECYNEIRGMYGYTGYYQGKRVSVQGTGMGMPSIAIYAHELITGYGVKNLIRIGSCGGLQPDIHLRDIILAMGASSDSGFVRLRFGERHFAPIASWELLKAAESAAQQKGIPVHVGNILSSDNFYREDLDPEAAKTNSALWRDYGILAIEMETTALYTLAAKFGVKALSILTVSDLIGKPDNLSAVERETGFNRMVEIALELA